MAGAKHDIAISKLARLGQRLDELNLRRREFWKRDFFDVSHKAASHNGVGSLCRSTIIQQPVRLSGSGRH
jgi:hypothetical protein